MSDEEKSKYELGAERARAHIAKRARPNPVTNKLGEPFKGPMPKAHEGDPE